MNPSLVLAVCGIVAVPAYSFQSHIAVKALQCLFSSVCVVASGRKVRLLPTVLVFLAIVFIHLLSPTGRVLCRVGGFPITLSALEIGLDKALLIIGLVFISRFTVRAEGLVRRGRNSFLELLVSCFDRLTNISRKEAGRLPRSVGGLVEWIDRLLLSVEGASADTGYGGASAGGDTTRSAQAILTSSLAILFAAAHWGFFILGRLGVIPDIGDL